MTTVSDMWRERESVRKGKWTTCHSPSTSLSSCRFLTGSFPTVSSPLRRSCRSLFTSFTPYLVHSVHRDRREGEEADERSGWTEPRERDERKETVIHLVPFMIHSAQLGLYALPFPLFSSPPRYARFRRTKRGEERRPSDTNHERQSEGWSEWGYDGSFVGSSLAHFRFLGFHFWGLLCTSRRVSGSVHCVPLTRSTPEEERMWGEECKETTSRRTDRRSGEAGIISYKTY